MSLLTNLDVKHLLCGLQIYASPIYELLDTKFGRFHEKTWSFYNTMERIVSRGCVEVFEDIRFNSGFYRKARLANAWSM